MFKSGLNFVRLIVSLSTVAFLVWFAFAPQAAYNAPARLKPYYSGDAINYNGYVYFASTNMKGVEIFQLINNRIFLIKSFSTFDAVYSGGQDFNSALFKVENGLLYLYLSDGKYIYKYDLADPRNPLYKNQVMDNSYDWFLSLSRCGDNLVSVGTKGVKIWNDDLITFYSNPLTNTVPDNIQLDPTCNYIFNIDAGQVNIFDRLAGAYLTPIKINANENHTRKILFSNYDRTFYLVDDQALRQYNYDGNALNTFEHISRLGYDAAASADPRYLYFSDGIGVVKSLTANLQPYKWAFTTDLGSHNGWAMELYAVEAHDGEKVVVFNNSSILVLDENLRLVDYYLADLPDNSPLGGASITADKTIAHIGELVQVTGQGFMPHEDIKISLAGSDSYFVADDYGGFFVNVETPAVKAGLYDLSALGLASNRSYAVSFQITN